jgi:hypothetical protein
MYVGGDTGHDPIAIRDGDEKAERLNGADQMYRLTVAIGKVYGGAGLLLHEARATNSAASFDQRLQNN